MSSGWFDYTEPFRTTSSQGDQGVYNTYTLVQGGSTTANFLFCWKCQSKGHVGCAITATIREVYVRAIRKVRYIICTGLKCP